MHVNMEVLVITKPAFVQTKFIFFKTPSTFAYFLICDECYDQSLCMKKQESGANKSRDTLNRAVGNERLSICKLISPLGENEGGNWRVKNTLKHITSPHFIVCVPFFLVVFVTSVYIHMLSPLECRFVRRRKEVECHFENKSCHI